MDRQFTGTQIITNNKKNIWNGPVELFEWVVGSLESDVSGKIMLI